MTGAEFDGVDLDLLADYVGGALTGTPDEDRVAALVASDPAWRDAYGLLEPGMSAVGAALRDFEPEPMPDDVAARLDALFRGPERAEPVPSKVVDLARARRMRRWAAPIAVAAAVIAFAGVGVSLITTAPKASMNDSEAPAAARGGAEVAPMVAAAPPPEAVMRTGTDYTGATLASAATGETQVAGTFGGSASPPSRASGVTGAEPAGQLEDLAGTDALAACLEAIARENGGGAIAVELVDYARFEGAPALIVRFSAANGIWVWAVGPACGIGGVGADSVEQLPVR